MQFFKTVVSLALAAFAAVASAQTQLRDNAITAPTAGTVIDAGSTFEIKWMNIEGQQVTLVVMDGAANGLRPVRTIVTNLPNTGTYTWKVPEDLPASGTYTIRISYDGNPTNWNYSDRFVFTSDFVSTSSATTSAPTTSTSSAASTTSGPSSSETTRASTTIRTTSTRRSPASESTSEPTSQGAPPSAGTTTLSSPLAVIMAVLAATLFIH